MAQLQELPGIETLESTSENTGSSPNNLKDINSDEAGIELRPRDYAQTVRDHSQTSISNSLYSGQRFESLAQFLWSPYQFVVPGLPSHSQLKAEKGVDFATLYELFTDTPPAPVRLRQSSSHPQVRNTHRPNRLLFLRGYPSAAWLNEIGASYKIDPEFFHRHLSFLSSGQHHTQPEPFILPSSQSTIFQLTITSVGSQESGRHADINSKRNDVAKRMEIYLHNLKIGQGWRCQNSVVRSFNAHSETEFSIEQAITVYVASTDKALEQWIVVVWLDCGDDLGRSPRGPWLDSADSQFLTHFRPIALYKPNIALKDHQTTATLDTSSVSGAPPIKLPQSVSLLPELYGRSLNTHAMSMDPFYALTELFEFFCASELEMLNTISIKLDEIRNGSADLETNNMTQLQTNLAYHRKVLEDHVHKISETWTFIKNRSSLKWPRSHMSKAINAAARIEQDLTYLKDRSRVLQERCERELNIMNNNANIAEARRGIEQGKRVFNFTVLAFLYVPFSFSCSIFGMNFVQFSDLRQGYWAWAGVTLPILAISILVITWDFMAWNGRWLQRWFQGFDNRRSRT